MADKSKQADTSPRISKEAPIFAPKNCKHWKAIL